MGLERLGGPFSGLNQNPFRQARLREATGLGSGWLYAGGGIVMMFMLGRDLRSVRVQQRG
jgi:hypothetical protein